MKKILLIQPSPYDQNHVFIKKLGRQLGTTLKIIEMHR